MAQTARYLFDLDFSAPPEPEIEEVVEEIPPEPMITLAEHEKILEQAKAEAHARGHEEAMQERQALASEQVAQTQETLLGEVAMIYTEVGHLMARLEKDASRLAFSFASRFAEKLVAQEPKAEILALLHQVLAPLRQTPHIAIRLNPEVTEEISQHIEDQMQALGFEGKLSLLPDETIMAGDCEVEWVDGGIGRNLRAAMRKANKLLEDHFAHIPDDYDAEQEAAEDAAAEEAEARAAEDQAKTEQEGSNQDEAPATEEFQDHQDQTQSTNPDIEDERSDNAASPDTPDMPPLSMDQDSPSQDQDVPQEPAALHPENMGPASAPEMTPDTHADASAPVRPANHAPETGGEAQ